MNKYEKYKNSGVEWVGDIPEYWEVTRLKFITNIYNGDSLNESMKLKFESNNIDELPYISSKDIDLDTSKIEYENGLRIPKLEHTYKVAKMNSALLCIEGGSAGRKLAFTNQNVCFVNKLACFEVKDKNYSKFLFYSLKGSLFQTQFKLSLSGLIGGVAISNIKTFKTYIPPLEEQEAIAKYKLEPEEIKFIESMIKTME